MACATSLQIVFMAQMRQTVVLAVKGPLAEILASMRIMASVTNSLDSALMEPIRQIASYCQITLAVIKMMAIATSLMGLISVIITQIGQTVVIAVRGPAAKRP